MALAALVDMAVNKVERRLDAHVDARVGCCCCCSTSSIVTGGEGKGGPPYLLEANDEAV